MTAPRMFTTLLTEALRKLGPASARANQWAERLATPKGYSRQEFETYLAPILREEMEKGNRALTASELAEQLDQRGAVSEFTPTRQHKYPWAQRVDSDPEADYAELVPVVGHRGPGKSRPHGPHQFVQTDPERTIIPSWARMENVETERGVREPMATQIQSDQATHVSRLRPVAKDLARETNTSIAENIPRASSAIRRALTDERYNTVHNRRFDALEKAETKLRGAHLAWEDQELRMVAGDWGLFARNQIPPREKTDYWQARAERDAATQKLARTGSRAEGRKEWWKKQGGEKIPSGIRKEHANQVKDFYTPSAWDANDGNANYRPAIAMAIRDAVDKGHDRLLFPSQNALQEVASLSADGARTNVNITRSETERMLRAVGVEPEWETASVRTDINAQRSDIGVDPIDFLEEFRLVDLEATLADARMSRDSTAARLIEKEIEAQHRFLAMTDAELEAIRTRTGEVVRTEEGWTQTDHSTDRARARAILDERKDPDDSLGRSILHKLLHEFDDTPALRLDKLKDKPLPILGAAILAGAGASSAEAQEPDDPPVRLEGETDEAYVARVREWETAQRAVDDAMALLEREEGFRDQAYQDQGGTWTIGFGRTHPLAAGEPHPHAGMTTDRDTEYRWSRNYLQNDAARMRRDEVQPTPQTLSAAYNLGFGGYRRTGAHDAARAGDWERVAELLGSGTNTIDGEFSQGLTDRRQREQAEILDWVAQNGIAQEAQEDDILDLESIRQAIAASAGAQEGVLGDYAGLVSPEDDGAPWGRIGAVAAAIGAAALGARSIAGKVASRQGLSLPPIPGRGLRDQLTTQAPPTHPATTEEMLSMTQYRIDRAKSISRARRLSRGMDPNSEIARDVEDIIVNGPSMARQMRPVDAEIADIQESLLRHGLVKGMGRVPNTEWLRMAQEIKAAAGGREFWLDNVDRVMASPELTATAISMQESGEAMAAAIRQSLDPRRTVEEQEFASRYADEMMTRLIGAQQRFGRDINQVARTLQSVRLLKDLYRDNQGNAAGWMMMANKLAGKELDKADAHAIAHLVTTGEYAKAAGQLNKLRTAHVLDKADEWRRGMMQLAFMRPLRDLMSNTPNTIDKAVARRVAGIADVAWTAFTGGQRTVMPPGLTRQFGVMWSGGRQGLRDAARMLFRRPVQGDIEFMRRVSERTDLTNETQFQSRIGQWIGSQMRRWFTAADYPAYRAAKNDALADLAMVAAYNNGARGRQLVQDALAIYEHPGTVLTLRAEQEAIAAVWQNPTAASIGWSGTLAKVSPGTRFLARAVVPFVHTTASMVDQALQASPVGTIKTASQLTRLFMAVRRKEPDFELQRTAMLRVGAHATGAFWMGAGAYLSARGDLRGAYNESDRRGNEADEERNIRPMTMRVDGKWYAISMLLGPQAMLMALGAAMQRGFMKLAEDELEDPTYEKRWYEKAGTVAAPMLASAWHTLEELPMADGFSAAGRLARDVKDEEYGAGAGQYLGRMAASWVPAFVQQHAGAMDRDETGAVVRRETRGADFSEAFSATVKNAIPGLRGELPERRTPFGRTGSGYDLNVPAQAGNPGRTRYREHEDWVTDGLVEHDAFPARSPLKEGESRAEYSARRAIEGPEEREALGRALNNEWDYGMEYAGQKAMDDWGAVGFAIPSPEYTNILRRVVSGVRSRRTREANKARDAGEPR